MGGAAHLQAHYAECSEFPIKCERCSQSVKKSALDDHLDHQCPYLECSCGEMVGFGVMNMVWGAFPGNFPRWRRFPGGFPLGIPTMVYQCNGVYTSRR